VPPSDGPCFLAGSCSGSTPARRVRGSRDRFPPRADLLPCPRAREGAECATKKSGTRASPAVRSPVHHPVARMAAATTARSRRARRLVARPPASKLCSPRESVRARTVRSPELSPLRPPGPRAVALLGLSPSGAFPTTVSGPVDRENEDEQARPHSRKTTPRSGTERGASILRPRPSESGGRVRSADPTRHRRTLRASAPPLGGAPSSRALVRAVRRERRPTPGGLQRFEGRGSGPISRDRPAPLRFSASSTLLALAKLASTLAYGT
jgi:hypothetical protein